ncbi:MAG: hypothetical protein K5888_03190 [Lachnospiraceae bacterium]|nr:hypothetical protein [Lachnospiraceae bacterium]
MIKRSGIFFNMILVIFTICGTYAMLTSKAPGSGLTASGFENLKFFTVLSNEFCGIVALLWLIFYRIKKGFPVLLKLMAASATGLTFVIIAAFLAPLYPDLNLYSGGNLWFHLIIPLTAMADFILMRTEEKIPFGYTFISALLSLAYGTFYLVNILINGIGQWPDTNDWYGFLNWGFPVGIGIFAFVVLLDFAMACLLRFINHRVNILIEDSLREKRNDEKSGGRK